jgi:hypothetical protein
MIGILRGKKNKESSQPYFFIYCSPNFQPSTMMQTRFSSKPVSPPFTGRDIMNLEARKKMLEKPYLKIEQEEAFKEVIKIIGANGAMFLMVKWIKL